MVSIYFQTTPNGRAYRVGVFFFSSRRRHTRCGRDWSSDVCSSDLLSMMWPHEGHWPGAIVPLQVGVLEFPIPTARRCFRLGKSLRRAIESYPEDLRVAIVATGGLAHQVHGERAGFNNTPWDMEFLDLLEREPERLSELTIAQYAERGGLEGAEVIMWLIMRGALSAKVRKLHSA